MEFNELKMIWDSQNEEPLYAMNEAALHAIVQRRNEEVNCCLARCFAGEITVGVVCGGLMLLCASVLAFGSSAWIATLPWMKVAASRWDIVALLVAAGIWFYYSAYMFAARKRQQRRVEVFESTLPGDLERAQAQTEFQITMARNALWRGLVPVWVAGAFWVGVLFHLEGAPAWTFVFMGAVVLGSLVTVASGKQQAITNRYQPRLRELESLRAKLADPQR